MRKAVRALLVFAVAFSLSYGAALAATASFDSGSESAFQDTTDTNDGTTSTDTDTTDTTTDTTDTESSFQDTTDTNDGSTSDTNDGGTTEDSFQDTTDTSSGTSDTNDGGTTEDSFQNTTDTNDSGSTEDSFQNTTDQNDSGSTEQNFQSNETENTTSSNDTTTTADNDSDSDSDSGDNETNETEVITPPTAEFDYTPKNPETGREIRFNASGSSDPDGSITSYKWDFNGDGSYEKTGVRVEHSFPSAGDHTVMLTVADDDGETDTSSKTVSVQEKQQEDNETPETRHPETGNDVELDPGKSLSLYLSTHYAKVGEVVDVTGVLEGKDADSVVLEVDGEAEKRVRLNSDTYTETVVFESPGTHKVSVRSGEMSETETVKVVSGTTAKTSSSENQPALDIIDINMPNSARVGEEFQVCPEISSPETPTVYLYEAGKLIEKNTGRNPCFHTSVQSAGEIEYAVKAEAAGEKAWSSEEIVVRAREKSTAGPTGMFSALAGREKLLFSVIAGLLITGAALVYGRES